MSGDENNEEEIVTDGQEEKGGIQDAEDDKPQSAEMKKQRGKMAEEDMHALIVQQLPSAPRDCFCGNCSLTGDASGKRAIRRAGFMPTIKHADFASWATL